MNVNKTSNRLVENINKLQTVNENHRNITKIHQDINNYNNINNKRNNYINFNLEYLIKNISTINEETNLNDKRLINKNDKISPCLTEILFNRPSKNKKLNTINNHDNSLRTSLKTLPLNNTIYYKNDLNDISNNNNIRELELEENEKLNKKEINLMENNFNDNNNPNILTRINIIENENVLTLKEINNIIEIEENLENNEKNLNEKLKQIRKTVNTLKINTYDSNSTNEINYGYKTQIFSEEELNKEVQKINDKVKK
jgi:hypothetical protein